MKAGCLHCANSANGMFKHRGVNTEFLAPWETVTQPTALSSAFILKQSVLGSFGFPPTGRNYNLQWLCLPPAPAWWNCVSLSCLFSLPWYVFLSRYSPAITWLSWPPSHPSSSWRLPTTTCWSMGRTYPTIPWWALPRCPTCPSTSSFRLSLSALASYCAAT